MTHTYRPTVERLEERTVPALFGVPWPDGRHLTFSFPPDGTPVGTEPNQLFALLDAVMPRSEWQLEVLRAFQTWAVQADLNLGLVGDSGHATGTAGPIQGD